MEKIINYTLGINSIFPEECLCGGVQGEHRATYLCFSPDSELSKTLENFKEQGLEVTLQIDAVTLSGELAESEKRVGEELFAPFYLTNRITSSGLDCVIVVRIFVGNQNTREVCKAQIQLCFTPSPIGLGFSTEKSKENDITKVADDVINELTEKAQEIEETLNAKVDVVRSSAGSVARHLKQIEQLTEETNRTILELSEGTTVVFSGGGAEVSSEIDVVVDEYLSEISKNPVQNKAITNGINQAVETATNTLRQELTEKINTDIAEKEAELNQAKETFTDGLNTLRQELTVETGTSGIWQYEKWPNGTLKCFAEKSVKVKPEIPWGDAHFYAPIGSVEFPEMFQTVPQLIVSVEDDGANFLVTKRVTEKTNTGTIYVLSLEKFSEETTVKVCLDAKGRWK